MAVIVLNICTVAETCQAIKFIVLYSLNHSLNSIFSGFYPESTIDLVYGCQPSDAQYVGCEVLRISSSSLAVARKSAD